ncbi:MAG: cysteine desulfurase family protein [Pseudomonadota bacterium]
MVIYLDHMASTPLDPAVRQAMLPWLEAGAVGNPHSQHGPGWRAAKAIEQAREQVANLIGAQKGEIYFTSGATEADNLALFGTADLYDHLITTAIEHPAILEPAAEVSGEGKRLTVLRPGGDGRIDLGQLEEALADGPALVSIMAANNEIGVLQDLSAIGALCQEKGALFHTDAVQAISSQKIDVVRDTIDLLSLSGHKIYGPGGIGALYVRAGVDVEPLVFGGGHQAGLRPGTVPVALCVALGAACETVARRREADSVRIRGLKERMLDGLRRVLPSLTVNSPAEGVPGCLSVTVPGVDAADLLLEMPGLAASTGSACSSLESSPSHVLRAIGRSAEEAHGTLRFGIGRHTTADEVDRAVALIGAAVEAKQPAAMDA